MPKNQEIEELNDKIIEKEKISEEVEKTEVKNKARTTKKSEKTVETINVENKKDFEGKSKSTKKETEEQKEQIDEATVIEKIKSFIAKIAAMQEEARKELQANKEDVEEKEEKTTKTEKTKDVSEPKKVEYLLEYYDLPYRYNETVVKILAQTPKRMFVYWDISDNDREKYVKTFGEDFFYKTYPVLLLYNEDKKYVKEIPIDDFANSWYIDIQDPKTKYTIQLGRKFRDYSSIVNIDMKKVVDNSIILHTDYLPIANSNILEIPNDHVLLEELPNFVVFRNVKTNQETTRDLKKFKAAFGNNYGVKEFYEEYYKDEISEGMFDMANPSSKLTSSSFK